MAQDFDEPEKDAQQQEDEEGLGGLGEDDFAHVGVEVVLRRDFYNQMTEEAVEREKAIADVDNTNYLLLFLDKSMSMMGDAFAEV